MISDQDLLFIEPRQAASSTPVIDRITRRMCAAFRQARGSDWASGGYHRCCCGALSEDHDFHLPNGELTNSLCVHYVAYHRSEVPPEQLARIEAFPFGEREPTRQELHEPPPAPEKLLELQECPAELHQVFHELDAQIAELTRQKESAIAEFDFEKAANLRDKADTVTKKKLAIGRQWLESKASMPAEPDAAT